MQICYNVYIIHIGLMGKKLETNAEFPKIIFRSIHFIVLIRNDFF